MDSSIRPLKKIVYFLWLCMTLHALICIVHFSESFVVYNFIPLCLMRFQSSTVQYIYIYRYISISNAIFCQKWDYINMKLNVLWILCLEGNKLCQIYEVLQPLLCYPTRSCVSNPLSFCSNSSHKPATLNVVFAVWIHTNSCTMVLTSQ